MTRRNECAGVKDDNSDKCDLFDSEGYCRFYGDTWKDKDGVFRGGEDVAFITYCTHRTIKGKRINDSMNPLYMDRICHWTEVMFNGEIRSLYHELYNPEGIIVFGDGTMYDTISRLRILPDGTKVENDSGMTPGNYDMWKVVDKDIDKRIAKFIDKVP